MPPPYTRADCLREYLTGAASDGGSQSNPLMSLGNYRSSTEAASLGINIANAISGVVLLYAGGANGPGSGLLTATDANTLTWQPPGSTIVGPPSSFSGTSVLGTVEGPSPGQYLRVSATTPFSITQSTITLSYLMDNVFSLGDVNIANAISGVSNYTATIVRNEGTGSVSNFQRYLGLLGSPQPSDSTWLPASGLGTIVTSSSFLTWPTAGWCQVRSSGGTLKETVYYSQRTSTSLSVTTRALLGTTATAGSSSDVVYPVPGIAIGIDPAGPQSFGSLIQTISSTTTAPIGVTWNQEITPVSGLQIGTLSQNYQVGLWIWRQSPPNLVSTPQALILLNDSFGTY